MSSRVAGAALALIAAALLAVSIATPAVLPPALSLFAGNPTVDGHVRKSQNMYVGLYNAQLCNNGDVAGEDRGGETVCKTGDSQGAFHLIGFAELGATGLGLIALLGLGVLTLKRSDRRHGFARVVRIASVLGLAGAGGLIAAHPVGASAAIPIGVGLIVHVAGLTVGLLASVIAVRPPSPLKLRSKPVAVPPPPQGPGIDVDKLFGDDQLRPTAPPSYPSPVPYQSPYQPQPHAAMAATGTHPGSAPGWSGQQLRPLYDATPMQGGTGGLMPFERPVLPSRAPTPVPRSTFEVDIDMEPSMVAPLPVAPPSVPQPAPPPMQAMQAMQDLQAMHAMAPAPERTKPKTLPPPRPGSRSKPMTAPPALPPARPALPFMPSGPFPDDTPPPAPLPAFVAAEPARASSILEPSGLTELPPDLDDAASDPVIEPPPPSSADSDGRPEAALSSPTTEPTALPEPPPPAPPPPKSASASGSVPAIPAAPSRPQRDTRGPAMRASVPLPARPVAPTRPPPLRAGVPKTIASPVVPPPIIPPIPGIPTVPSVPTFTMPATTAQRAATEMVPELAAARVAVEITDNASQTNVSSVPAPSDGTAQVPLVDALHDAEAEALASEPSDTGADVRVSDTAPAGQSTAGVVPLGQPTSVAFPVPLAMASPAPVGRAPKLPISTAPDSLPPPKDNKSQASGPSPACPQCEAPMAWVEEHLRFYCKSCRMYF